MLCARKWILIGGCFVVVIISIIYFISKSQNNRHIDSFYPLQNEEILPYLEDGDIIFRLGDRFWSSLLKNVSQNEKKFSHIGIVRIKDDIVSVIHSEGFAGDGKDFVKEVPLEEFLSIARNIGIYRLINVVGSEISDIALEYLGFPFDWDFDMTDDTRLYCTELLYVILKRLSPETQLNTMWFGLVNRTIIPVDIHTQEEYFYEVGFWER